MMFINVLKRSSTVASSVSKYYVQSLNLHHHVPVLIKAPERPIFVRNFHRTSLNCSDETEGEPNFDKVAENLSVDIANVCIIVLYRIRDKRCQSNICIPITRCFCTGSTWITTTQRSSPLSYSTNHQIFPSNVFQ